MKKITLSLAIALILVACIAFYFALREHDVAAEGKLLDKELVSQRRANKDIFELRAELKVADANLKESIEKQRTLEEENKNLKSRDSVRDEELKKLSHELDDEKRTKDAALNELELSKRSAKEQSTRASEMEKKLVEERALTESLNGELIAMRSDPQYKSGLAEAKRINLYAESVSRELTETKKELEDLRLRLAETQERLDAVTKNPRIKELEEELEKARKRISEVEGQNLWLRREQRRQ